MMNTKLLKISLIILSIILFSNEVNAKEYYYVNGNGVSFTKEEFTFLQQFYWNTYPEQMSINEYHEFIKSGMLDAGVETKYLDRDIQLYSSSVSDPNKTLKISKSCPSNYCKISVTTTWNSTPKIKSYDVIGAYLNGTDLLDTPKTTIVNSLQTSTSSEIVKYDNGFGVSVKIPTAGTNLIINQTYKVSTSGTV